MEELLTGYADKTLRWLESGAAWIAGEIPLYVNELLRWEIASSILGIFTSIGMTIVPLLFIKSIMKLHYDAEKKKSCYSIYSGEWKLLFIPIAVISIIGIFSLMFDVQSLIKVLVAPRVYLIEYFSNIVN